MTTTTTTETTKQAMTDADLNDDIRAVADEVARLAHITRAEAIRRASALFDGRQAGLDRDKAMLFIRWGTRVPALVSFDNPFGQPTEWRKMTLVHLRHYLEAVPIEEIEAHARFNDERPQSIHDDIQALAEEVAQLEGITPGEAIIRASALFDPTSHPGREKEREMTDEERWQTELPFQPGVLSISAPQHASVTLNKRTVVHLRKYLESTSATDEDADDE